MKDYNIDKILRPAFKMFLTYNYESVSTSRLEKEAGMSRGALYYKHKSKEELFRAVIDRYILDFLSAYSEPENMPLKDFIDLFLEQLAARIAILRNLGVENIQRGFYNLLYEALKFYPEFCEKMSLFFENNLKRWTIVVQHALDNGEISSSLEAKEIAQQFCFLYTGMGFQQSMAAGLEADQLQKAFHNFYNMLKK